VSGHDRLAATAPALALALAETEEVVAALPGWSG
jgi:hypothetical protein